LRSYRPGALYSSDDKQGYILDSQLNEARDFFVEHFVSLSESDQTKASCIINLVLNLGIVRANVEDYMIVLQLLRQVGE